MSCSFKNIIKFSLKKLENNIIRKNLSHISYGLKWKSIKTRGWLLYMLETLTLIEIDV